MGNQSKFARGRQQQRWEGEREENNNNDPPAEPMLPAPALALVMSTVDSQLESARNQPNEPLRESAYVKWLTMALLAGWLAGWPGEGCLASRARRRLYPERAVSTGASWLACFGVCARSPVCTTLAKLVLEQRPRQGSPAALASHRFQAGKWVAKSRLASGRGDSLRSVGAGQAG